MKDLTTLSDLMADQLASLYDAELRWAAALQQNMGQATSRKLRKLYGSGIRRSGEHARKLKDILDILGKNTPGKQNAVVRGLIGEMEEIQADAADTEVRDAGLILTHQCMNHYLIAKYGTVSAYAALMKQEAIGGALHAILEEEKREDRELSLLAEEKINAKARTLNLNG